VAQKHEVNPVWCYFVMVLVFPVKILFYFFWVIILLHHLFPQTFNSPLCSSFYTDELILTLLIEILEAISRIPLHPLITKFSKSFYTYVLHTAFFPVNTEPIFHPLMRGQHCNGYGAAYPWMVTNTFPSVKILFLSCFINFSLFTGLFPNLKHFTISDYKQNKTQKTNKQKPFLIPVFPLS
jgi:hypothetical protein